MTTRSATTHATHRRSRCVFFRVPFSASFLLSQTQIETHAARPTLVVTRSVTSDRFATSKKGRYAGYASWPTEHEANTKRHGRGQELALEPSGGFGLEGARLRPSASRLGGPEGGDHAVWG